MTEAHRNATPKGAARGGPRPARRGLRLPRERQVHNAHEARSRAVHLMRLLSPAAALALVVIVVVWAQWQTIESGFKIGFSLINPEEAKTLRMVNPRFSGMSNNTQPYVVTADEAVRATPTTELVHLSNPKGDITTESGAWVMLMAPTGVYDEGSETLDLSGGVDLFHDEGLRFASPTARIDLKNGLAEGHETATANGPSIDITGEGFKVLDEGKRIIFTGNAKAVLYPRDDRERKAPPERPG